MRIVSLYNVHAGRASALLAGIVGLSVFLYGGFMLGAVAHAAGATSAERQARELGAKVSALETEYLAAAKELSFERAQALGFVVPASVATVYAVPPALTYAPRSAAR